MKKTKSSLSLSNLYNTCVNDHSHLDKRLCVPDFVIVNLLADEDQSSMSFTLRYVGKKPIKLGLIEYLYNFKTHEFILLSE